MTLSRPEDALVVGVGASAGGSEALVQLFSRVAPGSGAAFVVVQHLFPDAERLTDRLLARHTKLVLHAAEDGAPVLADRIYLVPPRVEAALAGGRLVLSAPRDERRSATVVDALFQSLARELGPRAAGVVLSGRGSDGSRGLRAIKAAGGLALVQDPSTAKHGGMPRAALASVAADAVLAPEDVGSAVRAFRRSADGGLRVASQDDAVHRVLELARRRSGIDFSRYDGERTRAAIARRASLAELDDVEAYGRLLMETPAEIGRLCRDLRGTGTEFFSDATAFDALADELREACDGGFSEGGFRAWVAGCGTGEDAYSIAMLLDELAGELPSLRGFRVFATDVAGDSLAIAGGGLFPYGVQDEVTPERLARYFEHTPEGYRVTRTLRDRVVFAQHDAAREAPFTRVQLACCRDLLRDMGPALREETLACLRDALVPGGLLLLGANESPDGLAGELESARPRHGLFRRLSDVELGEAPRRGSGGTSGAAPAPTAFGLERVCDALQRELAPASLVLDEHGAVLRAFGDSERYLARPRRGGAAGARAELTSDARKALAPAMNTARSSRRSVSCEALPFGDGDVLVRSDASVRFLPPDARDGGPPLFVVVLRGAASTAPGEDRLESELHETKVRLRATIEELGATNEEQSAVNEELLASNAELQEMNELLHSVNAELYDVNAAHQAKIEELTQLTNDVENLLRSIEVGTVFLDRELCIRSFTPQVEGIIALRPTDIGRPIRHLTHELKGVSLHEMAEGVARTGTPVERETVDGHGTPRLLRVLPYRAHDEVTGVVITLIDISPVKEAQRSLAESEQRFQELVERLDQVFWTTSPDGAEVLYLSPVAERLFGVPHKRLATGFDAWFERVPEDVRDDIRTWFRDGLIAGDLDLEYRLVDGAGAERWLHAKAFPVHDERGSVLRTVGFVRDVTRERDQRAALRELANELENKAQTDALTGLLNRRGLETALTRELSRARRGGHGLCVALVDLDDFKSINDQLGHATGDLVLNGASDRMRRTLRPTDVLARLGGDEFLVLLPESRLAEAVRAAERLRLAIADNPIAVSGRPLKMSASIGVSVVPLSTVSIEEVMDGTRQALAAGKRGGKDRVVAATDGKGQRIAPGGDDDPRVRELTDDGVIYALCQPIRDIESGRVHGYEMLSRGPDGPYSSPAEFLRLSLEKNILNLVDLKCLRACVLGSRILDHNANIHVNLYPSTLVDTPVERLVGLLEEAGGAHRFCVELSEQLFLGAPVYLVDAVKELRAHGVRIGIDDVGYGRSSIEALVLLEPDVIKLAREFVSGTHRSAGRRAGLERLVRASEALSNVLVAEGVEEEGERELLADLGVNLAQGYLWDRPLMPESAAK